MKQIVSGLMVVLIIVSMLTVAFKGQVIKADSTVIKVPYDYSTIQRAIEAANPLDIITVSEGLYKEGQINVTKPLTLLAKGLVIIDGMEKGHVFYICADGVTISGFTITNSSSKLGSSGIFVNGKNCNITFNEIYDCSYGIKLCGDYNHVVSNTIKDNFFGIDIESKGNEICGNRIIKNYKGIFSTGWHNIIYHNYFVNNTIQARDFGYNNVWCLSSDHHGNYWSDYTGSDKNRNGIGDSPYVIDENGIDNYPIIWTTYLPNLYVIGVIKAVQLNYQGFSGWVSYNITALITIEITEIMFQMRYCNFKVGDTVDVSFNYTEPPKINVGDMVEVFGSYLFVFDVPMAFTIAITPNIQHSFIKRLHVSNILITNFSTKPDRVIVRHNFTYYVEIKNLNSDPIYLLPYTLESFDPQNSVVTLYDWRPSITVDVVKIDPGSSITLSPTFALFIARQAGETKVKVEILWRYETSPSFIKTEETFLLQIYDLQNYILHVQSYPITGIEISYSGDYFGSGATSFDVGPKEASFTVTLNAPLVHEDYKFSYWLLDDVNMGQSNILTVKVDDYKRERTATAVYTKEVIKYTLHVKSEPITGVSISYSGDYSGTSITNFDIGPKDSRFRVVLTAPSTFQSYKFVYWYIPELKKITVENPFICYHLKSFTSFNELTVIAVYSKDTSIIDLKTVPIDYTGVISLAERGFEEYAGVQELKFSVNQKLSNLIVWFRISRWHWHPDGPLSTPKEYPNIHFNIRISSPLGTEYSVTMNTSRGNTDIWIPIPEPVQGSWTLKIIGFTEDSISTKCKYNLYIREDKSSIVLPLKVINLKSGMTEEKFGCSLWIQAHGNHERAHPLMPSHKEPFLYVITITFHSDLNLTENFPNTIAVGYDDVLGKRDDRWASLYINDGDYEGFHQVEISDPWVRFAIKWSFEGILRIIPGASELMGIIDLLKEFWNLNVQDWYKPVVEEAFDLYRRKLNDNELDIICFNVPTSLEMWEPKQTVKGIKIFCNLSLAPTADFKIYVTLAFSKSLNHYYIKPQVFEYKISGTTISLKEEKHKLYLGLYDNKGNYVGFDSSAGRVKEEIEGARYIDFMNGTTIIVIPPDCTDFQIIVDASHAEEQQENYNLTIVHVTREGLQIENNFQGTIDKNELKD